ncbi:hypothetical protein GP486_004110 [Trichoglossum hirsutum]|uniref:Uncharacterized protein n=1 Tax=Trichoglossum hirsutum TaxID=265104 RepID=A0A9P8RPM3_9PEZI|nr:hypothetical protein GP486_004110 [Trichoglossum hirsutum]
MSTDFLTHLFSDAARLYEDPDPWLDEIIRKELAEIVMSTAKSQSAGCPLSDIGDFLVRATAMLSRLTNSIVHGQHISLHTKRKIEEMQEEHDFSLLSLLDYMNEKHSLLKLIASQLQVTAEGISGSWRDGPELPAGAQRRNMGSGAESLPIASSIALNPDYQASGPARPLQETMPNVQSSISPSTEHVADQEDRETTAFEGSIQETVTDLLTSLSARGRGSFVCPYDRSCVKGGVGRYGEIVTFERNSAFRLVAHQLQISKVLGKDEYKK